VRLDPAVIARLTVARQPRRFLRVTPLVHRVTPLGLGFGETRFASPSLAFKVLYLGQNLVTAIAETVIRDRFVGRAIRRLTVDEVESWGVVDVGARENRTLLDLRTTGLVQLGVATDAVRSRSHRAGRAFSESLYEQAPHTDGILYPSRLTNGLCIAVYDRGAAKLTAGRVEPLVTIAALVPVLRQLNVTVISS